MTRTQWILLKLALKILPAITAMSGALFGYLEGHEIGHDIMATARGEELKRFADGLPWCVVLENVAIGTMLGLSGGIVLSCFGLVVLDCRTVVVDPTNRRTIGTSSSVYGSTGTKVYYDKYDVEDHLKSTMKVAIKYDNKKKKEEVEIKEMLEIGTDGIRKKKLGKRADNKTSTSKKRGL